uniref:Hyaluronan and proteoglycan link protein 1 n=1 Tax=Calidris pygmaea TaxID=425635 RepID=A0A8C3JDY9_9CHAR
MKSLLFLVLISACWAEPHPDNSSLEHERIIHIQENGPRLLVVAEQAKIFSHRGGNVTLPCKFYHEHTSSTAGSGTHKIRVKWTKLTSDYLKEVDVFVAMGQHRKSYGNYQGRVFLRESSENDASLIITNIILEDYGRYKCEVIEGLEDDTAVVALNLEGVVFPYSPRLGRYNLNFHEAQRACLDQDSVIASFDQLYDAWRSGMDWCNAGWLSDGSVQYPITKPREPCGGKNTVPGVRNYGFWDKEKSRYDVFCFTSNFNGKSLLHPYLVNDCSSACERKLQWQQAVFDLSKLMLGLENVVVEFTRTHAQSKFVFATCSRRSFLPLTTRIGRSF